MRSLELPNKRTTDADARSWPAYGRDEFDERPSPLSPDGYHLSRAGSWDPFVAEPRDIDDH